MNQKSLIVRLKNHRYSLTAILALALALPWLVHRAHAQTATDRSDTSAVTAGVAKVTRQDLSKEVTIAAEFRPFEEVTLHAKVSGYVKNINVDIGDKVRTGQLLATLEVPELKDQLANAEAAEKKAAADYTNAHLIYTRLQTVNRAHPNLVAEQDLDTAAANDQTAAAGIAAAKAEVERYKSLVHYTQITAPFDGVVTHRYADPGALIQAGTTSDTQALPLVRVSDNYRLRLDFPVTEEYVSAVRPGQTVKVRVGSQNPKTFTGKISRFSNKVDDTTRTMITEIEVPNPHLELMPGMYASVALTVETHSHVLTVPTEAVSGEKNPTVFVVNRDNQIEERPIKLGLETPDRYEVLSGVQEGDLVVIGNRAAFQTGQKVQPKLVQLSLNHED